MTTYINCSQQCGNTVKDLGMRKKGQAVLCDSCLSKLANGQIIVKQTGENSYELHERSRF